MKWLDIDAKMVHRLYFNEGHSQKDIAEKFGTSESTIRRIFVEHGWNPRFSVKWTEIDAEEVYRLYFDEGLTQRAIADKLGHNSDNFIRRVFREHGWESRKTRFENEEDRVHSRKERAGIYNRKINDMRNRLFGIECRICGVRKENGRRIAIHRKDGTSHDRNVLRGLESLRSLDTNEWVSLCTSCHLGVHKLMNLINTDWDTILSLSELEVHNQPRSTDTLSLPDDDTPTSARYEEIARDFERPTYELHRALFGGTCYYCGFHYEYKRLVTHRKDGRHHQRKHLWSGKYLRTLDPEEWVSLCEKCHRSVHIVMKTLNIGWDALEVARGA
jgi:transposase-like protein